MKMCSRCKAVPAPGYCRACMKRYLVETGRARPPMLSRCESCDEPFTSAGGLGRWCSADCRLGTSRRAHRRTPRSRNELKPCGTEAAYQRGCRCQDCRDAASRSRGRRPRVPCSGCSRPTAARCGTCMACRPAPTRSCPDCGGPRPEGKRRCGECADRANVESIRRARRAYRHRRRAGRRGARADYFTDVEIFERDGWRCHICRKPVRRVPRSRMDPERASLDHLWPLSKGGEHTRENVACAHLGCNIAKGSRVTPTQLALVG